jgi:hypothetical protein
MKKYKVIWFDDEWDELPIIREKASLNEINLVGFKSADEGIRELQENIQDYDAAIVDGNFFLFENQNSKPDDKALDKVAKTLLMLSERKLLPWFILSGQLNFTKERNKYADVFKGNKVYDKLSDEHLSNLWSDLKREAGKNIDTQLRLEHWKVFEVCTDKYIGTPAVRNLLYILKKENAVSAFNDSDLYFNCLRKVMEDFFKACNRIGILPENFLTGQIPLNECSRFFDGKTEKGYQLKEPSFITEIIAKSVLNIVKTTNSASHRSNVDDHVNKLKTPYLLLSVVYQLLDVLIWFKQFADFNKDREKNNAVYQMATDASTGEIGEICQDLNRNFYCGEFFLNAAFVKEHFALGDRIRIVKWTDNENTKTKDRYPKFASRFEKL